MNDLIKQLQEEATINRCWSVDECRYLESFVDQEKFAKLIIKHSTEVCLQAVEKHLNNHDTFTAAVLLGIVRTTYDKFGIAK